MASLAWALMRGLVDLRRALKVAAVAWEWVAMSTERALEEATAL